MSRTALDGFVMGDVEKDHLMKLIRHFSSVYFAEVLGFCIMGNHFHLLVRMHTGEGYDDQEIRRRFLIYYGPDTKRQLGEEKTEFFREKWSSLSEYVRDIKQSFTWFYNRRHHRKGFFWGERFKSVIVDNGDTLINCLAYIDLNPVRAGISDIPDDYRWCSLGYHAQSGNVGDFLSLDFGLQVHEGLSASRRLSRYRAFVYEKGSISPGDGCRISREDFDRARRKGFSVSPGDRFLYRTRYFIDSGIIGTREFVSLWYRRFRDHFSCRRDKRPMPVSGLNGIYSLKRLQE